MTDTTWTVREANGGGTADEPVGPPGLLVLFSSAPIAGAGVYPAQETLRIGRSSECEVFLEDRGMSRAHAVVRFAAGQAAAPPTAEDAGSSNGTFINGRRIADATPLQQGDVLRCGQTLLRAVDDVAVYGAGWRREGGAGPVVGGPALRGLLRDVAAFARTDLEVLIVGESGTGKELVAAEVHRHSDRRGPFVPLNCAALPEALFEAELFGAVRGAFTGAVEERQGLLRSAAGGTLFLDEVGELPVALQAKLLRAVELKEVRPVGGTQAVRVDVRLVAATNRDLATEAQRGAFRADLYHRLRGAHVVIPPLRERPEDIALLVEMLLRGEARRSDGPALSPTAAFVERLLLHDWPGNVRELDRVVREAAARARGAGAAELLVAHLREELQQLPPAAPRQQVAPALEAIRAALTRHQGNVSHAASELGMHRARVYALLREHGLRAEDFR